MDKYWLKTLKNQRKNGIISSVKMSALKEMKKPTKYRLFFRLKKYCKDEDSIEREGFDVIRI